MAYSSLIHAHDIVRNRPSEAQTDSYGHQHERVEGLTTAHYDIDIAFRRVGAQRQAGIL